MIQLKKGLNSLICYHHVICKGCGLLSVLVRVKVHGTKQPCPKELLTGVGVVMVTGIVQVVNVLEEVRNVTGLVEDGDQNMLFAICKGKRR